MKAMTSQDASAVTTYHKRRLPKGFGSKLGQYLVNAMLVIFFIFPLVFMLMSSFKGNQQIFSDLRSLRAFLPVGELSLVNYQSVFQNSSFLRFLANSIGIALVTIILALVVNSMIAYSLSRLKWPGQRLVLAIIIATLIIPGETVIMPLLLLVSRLPNFTLAEGFTTGWFNTYQVQTIPFITSAFSIFLFYQFFNDIPRELDEAALVDGASRFQIYRHIIVPNAGPVFATVTILTFLAAWNAFLWPIMVIQKEELRPVMVGMQYFFQQDMEWGEVMAYATMITIPVLVIFLMFQRSFVQSLASSGIKG
jgi:multiple sugar transport system permease protein